MSVTAYDFCAWVHANYQDDPDGPGIMSAELGRLFAATLTLDADERFVAGAATLSEALERYGYREATYGSDRWLVSVRAMPLAVTVPVDRRPPGAMDLAAWLRGRLEVGGPGMTAAQVAAAYALEQPAARVPSAIAVSKALARIPGVIKDRRSWNVRVKPRAA